MPTGGQTITQDNQPWAPAQPYILDNMAAGRGLINSGVGLSYFPTNTVIPFSNQTELGLQATEGRALAGNPLNQTAQGTVSDILTGNQPSAQYWNSVVSGDYLQGQNSNPYLDPTFDRMADQVTNRVNSAMGTAGRTGSGAHQDLLFDNLGDLANQVYGQNYQIERDRQQQAASALDQYTGSQLQAAGMSPALAQQDYYDIDRLMGVGQQREGKANQYMEDLINRWNFSQQAPWDTLARSNAIALGIGNVGGTAQSQQPSNFLSQAGGLLGGIGSLLAVI